ncbi:MAG TPA: LysM peptidoglycan-binding domain-containing protein [Gemmatimonadota bacterium]|nr:LysM peptidoglycan-binding domain-containing protein [Gemmatimonadota bacterium]
MMGLFDRDKKDEKKKDEKKKEEKKKADFSNVKSGSSTTAKPETPRTEAAKTYTVKGGDSLWKISEQMYGNGNEWRRIFEANKDRIKDPDVIQPGWVLNIPAHAATEGGGR